MSKVINSQHRPKRIRVHLISKSVRSPMEVSDSFDRGDCACGGNTMTILPENLLSLKFANREDELKTICTSGKPLLLIDAPAGYGKTYVLEEVERRLKDEWKCIIVRLEQCQGKRAIRGEIASQIKALNLPTGKEQEADNLLKRALGDAGKIILMFDSIERATTEDREWILSDFALNCVDSIPGTRFRVIVAGRYANVNFSAMLKRYETISLTPFSQKVVEEVLIEALRVIPPLFEIEQDRLKKWSGDILQLSGGHPRSIQRLVTDLAREKHWFINFPREKVSLFNVHVADEIDSIIGDLDDQMRDALEVLSVFRIFNFNVVQALQKASLPERVEFPREIDARIIVNRLAQYGLVEKDKNSVFYSDKIVRNLLLARIRISFSQIYCELNKFAQTIYDTWIEQLQRQEPYGPVDPQAYLGIFVKESIYHFCQSYIGDEKLTEAEMSACLRKHSGYLVQGLGVDERDPHYRIKLESMIVADDEIRQALEERNLDFQTLWKIAFPTNSSNFTKSKVDSVIQQGGSLVNSNEVGKNDADQVIPRKLRVFLSHASQDKLLAHELYNQLAVENWLDPWLDEENLLPGQDWQLEIEKAMETADAVIVCLSSESVSKDGYVQRELKYVIDIALEKPEGTIFIIPLRLDDCQIPRRVRSIQWMDYFPKEYRTEALRKILRSLEERRKKLGI